MNRNLILKDYFELKHVLNKANRLKNEKTDVIFEAILAENLEIRILAKVGGTQFLLIQKTSSTSWEDCRLPGFVHFKNYIIEILNKETQVHLVLKDADSLIKRSIHELLNYHSEDF